MEYLKNDICKFKPLFEFNPEKKQNIYCTTFFKMNKHYKDFNKYINGLKLWINYINNSKNDYQFRLFIDQNILDDNEVMTLINSCKKMQPVLYECHDYMAGKFHIDLFGTLLRFFPLFNFENNDAKKVFIVDMDWGSHDKEVYPRMDYVIEFAKKYKYPILSHYLPIIEQFYNLNDKITINSIRAAFLLFPNEKYDKNLIINFIKDASNIDDIGPYGKRLTTFGFGVDELFLNKYFINKINLKNAGLMSFYFPSMIIWDFLEQYKSIKNDNKTKDALKYILGKFYKEQYNVSDMLKLLDRAFYLDFIKINNKIVKKRINSKNIYNIYFAKRIYNYFKICIDKQIDFINIDLLKFIIKYFDNIILSISIANYNYKKMKIDKIYNLNSLKI